MRFAVVLILILCLSGAVFAQQAQTGAISLSLTDTDIAVALATLSQKANVSILGDNTVKGKVSCSLSGMTIDQALDNICKMNKLEWYKTYAKAGATEKPSASKLFKLLDALKDLGGAAVICSDPVAKTQTVYIPGAEAGSVDASTLATSMKLKEIYLVRAIPVPVEKTEPTKVALGSPLQGDAAAAAGQLYGYLQQMPMDQQLQTMNELRHQFFNNMTDDQRNQMRQYAQQQGWGRGGPGGGGNHGGGNGGPGGGQNGQGGGSNGQGGGHNHGNDGG